MTRSERLEEIRKRAEAALSTIQPEQHWTEMAWLLAEIERLEKERHAEPALTRELP